MMTQRRGAMGSIQFFIMTGGFVITVGTLVWRMAVLHEQCMVNKESLIRAHNRVDRLEDIQNNKIEELTKQIQSLKESQVRVEEKINLLIKYEKKRE
jgi:hypothetical protein